MLEILAWVIIPLCTALSIIWVIKYWKEIIRGIFSYLRWVLRLWTIAIISNNFTFAVLVALGYLGLFSFISPDIVHAFAICGLVGCALVHVRCLFKLRLWGLSILHLPATAFTLLYLLMA